MIHAITQVQHPDRIVNQIQNNIISNLNQIIRDPKTNGVYLNEVALVTGDNIINHTLGRDLQGWILVRVRSLATICDHQDINPNPSKTLILEASTNVVVDLFVF